MLFFPKLAVGLAWLVMTATHAADPTPEALQAADPLQPAAVVPLQLPPMGATTARELPADVDQARAIWQRANQRVAEFPRGHVDLLRWEARQPGVGDGTHVVAGAAPLSLASALRLSLQHRPDLLVHTGMNTLEEAEVRVRFAAHVRELQLAWIDAITARQRSRLLGEVLDATRTGSELGQRMVNAGNWSQARLTRERLVQAGAWSATVEAQALELRAREHLARLLELWRADEVARLDEGLSTNVPAVPGTLQPGPGVDTATLEATVLRSHPTLASDRQRAQRQFDAMSPQRWQAWRQAVDVALQAMPAADSARPLEPPRIEDLSLLRDPAVARAAQVESELLRQAAERRSMAREAWGQLQVRHAVAVHAQEVVVELQSGLAQDSLQRYNGMLQSTWELLASARERLLALDAALQARRDYWRAQAEWQALLSGTTYTGTDTPSSSSAAMATPAGH